VTQVGIGNSGVQEKGFRSDGLKDSAFISVNATESVMVTSHGHDGLPIYQDTGGKKKRATPNPLPPRAWTDAEDVDLVKGYQKHGFQWSLIARDPHLTFSNRTGAHVRDRFRLKFPDIYRDVSKSQRDALSAAKVRKGKESEKAAKKGNDGPTEVADDGQGHNDNGNDYGFQAQALSNSMSKQSLSAITPLNILGLLNYDEEHTRLSSFRYDDLNENVTLPPLLWEDMATRPMFDLE